MTDNYFVSATKIGPTLGTAIFQDKYTLWYIKQTIEK